MKLMHLGDLHLGKALGEFDLIEDQRFILNQILSLIDQRGVDAVLIAGDVYDRAVPSEAATRLLDTFLSALAARRVKVFLISGNHDSDQRLNYGSALFEKNQVYIASVFDGHPVSHTIREEDTGTEVTISLLPFVKASRVRHFFPDAQIETYEDAVRVILENSPVDTGKRNILVAHQFVAGRGADPELSGSEGAGAQYVGTVEKIGYDLFDAFDYVALGHIHSPQKVGREQVRYSGSPLKYSLSEVNNEKSVPLITILGDEPVQIELAALKPLRGMRHLKGTMKELLDPANVKDTNDFIYATFTDEDIIDDAMGIFQNTYPYTVKIDYDNRYTKTMEQTDITSIVSSRSFSDLIRDYYRLVFGCEISEEEMDVMKMAAREAGVIDEAG